MTKQEKDCIESAIRHIKTAVDVDEWANEIAVEAMKRQIPRKPNNNPLHLEYGYYCPIYGKYILMEWYKFCPDCGQRIDWTECKE